MELSKKNQYATAALAGVLSLSLASAALASDGKNECKGQGSCRTDGQ